MAALLFIIVAPLPGSGVAGFLLHGALLTSTDMRAVSALPVCSAGCENPSVLIHR